MVGRTHIKYLSFLSLVVSLSIINQHKSEANPSEANTPDKPIIYFGLRQNSQIGNEYCNDLLTEIEGIKTHRDTFEFQPVNINYDERLYQKREIKHQGERVGLAIECGTNTITQKRKNYLQCLSITLDGENYIPYPGRFSSKPFLEAGSKMLLLKGEENRTYDRYIQDNLFSQKNPGFTKTVITGSSPEPDKIQDEDSECLKNTYKEALQNTSKNLFEAIYPSAREPNYISNPDEICDQLKGASKTNSIVAYIGGEYRIKELVDNIKSSDCNLKQDFEVVPKYGTLNKEEAGIIVYEKGIPKECETKVCINEFNKLIETTVDNWSDTKFNESKEDRVNLLNSPGKWIGDQFKFWYRGDLTSLKFLIIAATTAILLIIISLSLLIWFYQSKRLYLSPINLLQKKINNNILDLSNNSNQEKSELITKKINEIEALKNSVTALKDSKLIPKIYPLENYLEVIRNSLLIAQTKLIFQEVLGNTPQLNNLKDLKIQVFDSSQNNQEFIDKLIRIMSASGWVLVEKMIENISFLDIPWTVIKAAMDEAIKENEE